MCLSQGISVKQYEDALAADGAGQTGDLKAMAEFVLKANKNAVSSLCHEEVLARFAFKFGSEFLTKMTARPRILLTEGAHLSKIPFLRKFLPSESFNP